MSEASRNLRTKSSFEDTPPEIAYLDPSFLLNVLAWVPLSPRMRISPGWTGCMCIPATRKHSG